jgi:uncharacterized protein (TIGR03382 family)
LKDQGDEPCVPLRLTRIAAVDDMDVRVFFLGSVRAVPSNYRHVLINPLKINWMQLGANYKEVISMAVDAFAAEGNAFVTEYAGTSNVVSSYGLVSLNWDAAPFLAMQNTPEAVGAELQAQGLMSCSDDGLGNPICEAHPLIEGLLAQYLPVPNGVTSNDFYSCMVCYAGLIDQLAWNAAEFGAAIDERVIQPGLHAYDLLQTWPYVTRMFTTISPNEMLIDPIFHTNESLPNVGKLRMGTRELLCDFGGAVFTLPDGRQVYMPDANVWPDVFGDQMPWEEDVEQAALVGPSQNLSDRTEDIDAMLAAWNEQHGWPSSGDGDGDGGQEGSSGESGSSSGGGLNDGSSGCTCSTKRDDGHGALPLLVLLGALGFRRRRAG